MVETSWEVNSHATLEWQPFLEWLQLAWRYALYSNLVARADHGIQHVSMEWKIRADSLQPKGNAPFWCFKKSRAQTCFGPLNSKALTRVKHKVAVVWGLGK